MTKQTTMRTAVLVATAAGAIAACSDTLSGQEDFTESDPSLLDRAEELDPALRPGTGGEEADDDADDHAGSPQVRSEILGQCGTPGCGGIVANHADSHIRVANCYMDGPGPIDDPLPCIQFANDWTRYPGSFWLPPNNSSSNYPAYYDTDTFIAFGGCKTVVNKWLRGTPILLGRWEYDNRNRGSQWIKLTDAEFIDILDIECQGAPPAPPPPSPPPPPPPRLGQVKVLSSNMCLVARAGAGERPVVQVPCAGFSDQVWTIDYLWGGTGPEGLAQIVNRDRNLCLVTRGSGESRAVVTTCNRGWFDQLWTIRRDPNTGYYQFVNFISKLCLVVRGGSPETQAVQSTCNAQWADQLWIWEGWF